MEIFAGGKKVVIYINLVCQIIVCNDVFRIAFVRTCYQIGSEMMNDADKSEAIAERGREVSNFNTGVA